MNAKTLIAPTPSPQIAVERLVVLEGVSWQAFKALLADIGDSRASRIAYDRGTLEIRMPQQHEQPKIMMASFVDALADELEIEVMQLGALLLEREDLSRAVEPDTCFYIQNESIVRSKTIQLPADPPPDLVIESDYTSSSLNKFNIYAAISVPELWRYRHQTLEVYQLVDENYELSATSIAFPFIPIAEILSFIEQAKTIGQRAAARLFHKRIQVVIIKNKCMSLYDSIGQSYSNSRLPDPRIVDFILNLSQLEPGSTIADIGAGTGRYSTILANCDY